MKKINLGNSNLLASEIALGCWRMDELSDDQSAHVIATAYENGINFFDHADIYGGGESEAVFAAGFKIAGINRENVFIQSKVGIRDQFFDFSKEHILEAVEGSLTRLNTDYLDVLLLHRPDALVEPEEVAEAFNILQLSGKVRAFGVSNQHPMQIALLQKYLNQKLIVNQLQFSPAFTGMVDVGLQVNMQTPGSVHHDGMLLDYCRLHDITIQAWSPFQYGNIEGVFFNNPKYDALTDTLRRIGKEKGTNENAMTAAWILRHPARIQVIIGSMNPARIADTCATKNITLSREEWYEIYRSAGNIMP